MLGAVGQLRESDNDAAIVDVGCRAGLATKCADARDMAALEDRRDGIAGRWAGAPHRDTRFVDREGLAVIVCGSRRAQIVQLLCRTRAHGWRRRR